MRWPFPIRSRRSFLLWFWVRHAPGRLWARLTLRRFSLTHTFAVDGGGKQTFTGSWPEVWADAKRWSARVFI